MSDQERQVEIVLVEPTIMKMKTGKDKLSYKKSGGKVSSTLLAKLPNKTSGNESLAMQSAQLSDNRLHTTQRQVVAEQIGQVQGNEFLQTVIPAKGNRNGSSNIQCRGRNKRSSANPHPGKSGYDAIQDFVSDAAAEWQHNKSRFDLALRQFQRRFTMTSEDETVPDVTGALIKHVVDKVTKSALDKLETLIPGWGEVKGALDAMVGELERAATATQGLTLRDFLMNTDQVLSSGFESQIRCVQGGRQALWETYNSLDPASQQMLVDSFPNWLRQINAAIPTAKEYEAALYIEWINRSWGQLSGYKELGVIEIKFNAKTSGSYMFESATVQTPFAKKVASGLNWIMTTPDVGMSSVYDLPIHKKIGLYCENIVGGMGYSWGSLDQNSNPVREPVGAVAKERWRNLPIEPMLKAIHRVSG